MIFKYCDQKPSQNQKGQRLLLAKAEAEADGIYHRNITIPKEETHFHF